jgi:hypothetical protein
MGASLTSLTICPGWPQMVIFWISAFQVARITPASGPVMIFKQNMEKRLLFGAGNQVNKEDMIVQLRVSPTL